MLGPRVDDTESVAMMQLSASEHLKEASAGHWRNGFHFETNLSIEALSEYLTL